MTMAPNSEGGDDDLDTIIKNEGNRQPMRPEDKLGKHPDSKEMQMEYDPGAVAKGNICSQCPELMRQVFATDARLQQIEKVNDRDHQEIKDSIGRVFNKMDEMRISARASAGIAHDDTVDAGEQRTQIAGRQRATLIGLTGRQFVYVLSLFAVAFGTPKILDLIKLWFAKG